MSMYKRGDKVLLTVRAGVFQGVIKHVSTVNGVKNPFVVEYRDANGGLRTHNASGDEITPRR